MNSNTLFDPSPVHAIAKRRGLMNSVTAWLIGAVVVLSVVFVFAWLDSLMTWSESIRMWLIGGALLVAIGVGFQCWWKGRSAENAQSVVRDMEASSPAHGQQLRTAWELENQGIPEATSSEAWTFKEQLLFDAQNQVRSSTWAQLVPTARTIRWASACGGILVVMAVVAMMWPEFRVALRRIAMPFGAPTYTTLSWTSAPTLFDDRHPPRLAVELSGRPVMPKLEVMETGSTEWQTRPLTAVADGRTYDAVVTGLTRDFQARVTAGDGTTPLHRLQYRPMPRLEETKLAIRFPEYTGREPEERESGDVSVVEGSTLDWSFRFNIPPCRVEWKLDSGTNEPQTVPVQADGTTTKASWKLPLGKFSGVLSVFDADGTMLDSWKYEVVGQPDKLPIVELLEPVKDTQATCVTELPVRIRARDDFGIGEVGLIMEAAGHTIWTLEKVIDEKNQRDVFELTHAMLETIPLTINDNIKLYAYALDHKPRGGPRAVSALRAIDIRDFKKHERLKTGDSKPKVNPMNLVKLNKLIKEQRVVVSACHVLKEEAKDENAEGIPERCDDQVNKQRDVVTKTLELLTAWKDEPGISKDDVTLLDTAKEQMRDAIRFLLRRLTEESHPAADHALTTLLQLRQHVFHLIGNCPCESEDDEQIEIKPLEELAREAERLADEEKSVQAQIAPADSKPIASLDSTRRQQEVAVVDGGELFAAIVTHPKRNENMEQLMAAAEKSMREADDRLHTKDHLTAQPPLANAEQNLRDLADFIHAMMEEKLAAALQKMASKAEGDAKKCEGSGGSGKGKGEAPKTAESGKDGKGDKGDATKTAASGEGDKGDANTEDKENTEQAARNAGLADDILKAIEQQLASSGGKDGEGKGDKGGKGDAESGMSAADLAALRKRAGIESLAKDLKQLAQGAGKDGKGNDDKANGKDGKGDQALAARLDKMAKELKTEAGRLSASRLARLAEVREQARGLHDDALVDQVAAELDLFTRLLAQGKKPGNKVEINGRTVTVPLMSLIKVAAASKGGNSNKSDVRTQNLSHFVAEAKRLGDPKLNRLLAPLEQEVTKPESIEGIIAHLDGLISLLPNSAIPQTASSRVPESHRRDIEAYRRNLSDDFSNETK